jgi:hypothetical protein
MGIDELAALVRAGLDADEQPAKGLLGAARFLDRTPDFYGAGGPAAEALWRRFSEARVLAEAAKRALLAEALGWGHERDETGWCDCEQLTNSPCTCGRDARVTAVLQLLATPYQEANRG